MSEQPRIPHAVSYEPDGGDDTQVKWRIRAANPGRKKHNQFTETQTPGRADPPDVAFGGRTRDAAAGSPGLTYHENM